MADRKITLYSPLKGESKTPNPAIREELSELVPAEQESDLPTRLISNSQRFHPARLVHSDNRNQTDIIL